MSDFNISIIIGHFYNLNFIAFSSWLDIRIFPPYTMFYINNNVALQ